MISYNLRLVIAKNKLDEFIDAMRFLSKDVCQEQGCLDFSLYRDLQKKNEFRVLGIWETRPAMEKHFTNNYFPVLIGAARLLGGDFEMSIDENLEKGSYPLAKEKIELQPKNGKIEGGGS